METDPIAICTHTSTTQITYHRQNDQAHEEGRSYVCIQRIKRIHQSIANIFLQRQVRHSVSQRKNSDILRLRCSIQSGEYPASESTTTIQYPDSPGIVMRYPVRLLRRRVRVGTEYGSTNLNIKLSNGSAYTFSLLDTDCSPVDDTRLMAWDESNIGDKPFCNRPKLTLCSQLRCFSA